MAYLIPSLLWTKTRSPVRKPQQNISVVFHVVLTPRNSHVPTQKSHKVMLLARLKSWRCCGRFQYAHLLTLGFIGTTADCIGCDPVGYQQLCKYSTFESGGRDCDSNLRFVDSCPPTTSAFHCSELTSARSQATNAMVRCPKSLFILSYNHLSDAHRLVVQHM